MFDEFGFYLETVYRNKGVNRHNYEKHYDHNLTEIIQVYSGSGVVLAGERALSMESGAVYIINGDYFHSFQPKVPSLYIRNKIIIDTQKFYSFLTLAGLNEQIQTLTKEGALFFTFSQSVAKNIDELFLTASRYLEETVYHPFLKFTDTLFSLLDLIFNHNDGFLQNYNPFLRKVTDYIKAHLSEEIRLDDICKHLYFSKSHLCHEFKRQTNMTLNEYIFRYKTSEAVKLLTLSNKTITEIAMETGFNSHSHFCQVFKRITSLSPSEYRKKK